MIIEAARAIGKAKAVLSFWFQGYNHSTQAVFKNNTLHNILLLTENICHPGAGPLSVTGEANTMGNRWVGALSHLLPGMRFVNNPQHRHEMANFWNIPVERIQPIPGRSIMEIIKGLYSGDVRDLWVMTTNPAASFRLEITEGEEIDVISRRGSIRLPARFTNRLLRGNVFIPWHYGSALWVGEGRLANLVTNPVYDIHSKQPEYKFSAVKIYKIHSR